MRYLIVSDIHANLEAFEKCMEISRGRYEQMLCLGDLVGYGPDPNPIVRAVRDLASVRIRGNHDKACSGITDAEDFNPLARWATMWTRETLTPESLASLRELPAGPAELAGCELVHGSPRDEDEYVTDSHEAMPAFEAARWPLVFFGHTHLQGGFVLKGGDWPKPIRCESEAEGLTFTLRLEKGARYLINPGSVGQPRDHDWRAAFSIFDAEKHQVEYYRTEYDLPATQKKMRKAGLPEPLITRLQFGR